MPVGAFPSPPTRSASSHDETSSGSSSAGSVSLKREDATFGPPRSGRRADIGSARAGYPPGMLRRTTHRTRRWLLFEEGCSIRIWIERPPSLAEWEDLLETLQAYLPRANKVVLEGRGWESESGRAVVRVLEDELQEAGVRLAVRALVG